jgi:mannose-6-phosphate isomerase
MLVPLSNAPRSYAWGSRHLLAELEGRPPAIEPEAEVWFGDHPDDPAVTADGRTLDRWLEEDGAATGAPARLPYLLKLLAAASNLSIQAHPSIDQAEHGFEREESAGIPREAPERTYRDRNHKPELIVALADGFRALVGLRPLAETRLLLSEIGPAGSALADRLDGTDESTKDAIAWILSDDAAAQVRAIIRAARSAASGAFVVELSMAADLDDRYPGDPGIVVALLMNLVTLRRGEGVFVPAGVLHAYLGGIGVEVMAASDNVVRGGLTPKHVDVPALVELLDTTMSPVPVLRPVGEGEGVVRYDTPVRDFALRAVTATAAGTVVRVVGTGIALATAGEVAVESALSSSRVLLRAGDAVLITPDEGSVRLVGDGDLFLATPGS